MGLTSHPSLLDHVAVSPLSLFDFLLCVERELGSEL